LPAFCKPPKTFFALEGVCPETPDVVGKRRAICALLYKQKLHKAPRLPWANTWEPLKVFG